MNKTLQFKSNGGTVLAYVASDGTAMFAAASFSGAVDVNAGLIVTGVASIQNLSVAGNALQTLLVSGQTSMNTLMATGVATFAGGVAVSPQLIISASQGGVGPALPNRLEIADQNGAAVFGIDNNGVSYFTTGAIIAGTAAVQDGNRLVIRVNGVNKYLQIFSS